MKYFSQDSQSGFTLFEILVYIVVLSMIILAFISFFLAMSQSRNKNYAIQEVHANTRISLQMISQLIRQAEGVDINNSIFDADPGKIVLDMTENSVDQTIITLDQDDGRLILQEGASEAVAITSKQVKITRFYIQKNTGNENHDTLTIEITASFNSSDNDFDYSQSVQTSVMQRI